MATFKDEWTTIKSNFTTSTKKKKPSDKFLGVFNKSSGLTPACAKLDAALAKADFRAASAAAKDLRKTVDAYLKTVAKAAVDKDANVAAEAKVMIGELGKLAEDADTAVEELQPPKKPATPADLLKLLQHKKFGPMIKEKAQRTYNTESLEFCILVHKGIKNEKTVRDYVLAGLKKEINISSEKRKRFEDLLSNGGDLKDAPWDAAVKEVQDEFLDAFDQG